MMISRLAIYSCLSYIDIFSKQPKIQDKLINKHKINTLIMSLRRLQSSQSKDKTRIMGRLLKTCDYYAVLLGRLIGCFLQPERTKMLLRDLVRSRLCLLRKIVYWLLLKLTLAKGHSLGCSWHCTEKSHRTIFKWKILDSWSLSEGTLWCCRTRT